MVMSSPEIFFILSCQKSSALNDNSEFISYTKNAPSAFLIWLVVIALYLSAPEVSQIYIESDILGSSLSISRASINPNSTPTVAS